jgi:hypothetical protein
VRNRRNNRATLRHSNLPRPPLTTRWGTKMRFLWWLPSIVWFLTWQMVNNVWINLKLSNRVLDSLSVIADCHYFSALPCKHWQWWIARSNAEDTKLWIWTGLPHDLIVADGWKKRVSFVRGSEHMARKLPMCALLIRGLVYVKIISINCIPRSKKEEFLSLFSVIPCAQVTLIMEPSGLLS